MTDGNTLVLQLIQKKFYLVFNFRCMLLTRSLIASTNTILFIACTACPSFWRTIYLAFAKAIGETKIHNATVSIFRKPCINIAVFRYTPESLGIKYIPDVQTKCCFLLEDLFTYSC